MILASMITDRKFLKIGKKTTICLLTLNNGFEIVGTSACVDPNNYDYEIGKKSALENAISNLNNIEGFILTEHLHLALKELKQQEEKDNA